MGRSGYETTNLWEIEESETPYSICSADTPAIEEDNPLFDLKDSFLQWVMAAYTQAWGPQHIESHQAIESIETPIEPISHDHDTNDRPRKRGRLSDGASTMTGEKQSLRSITKRRAQDRRLWLACPYAKKDPVRYRDCYRYFLARVRDVKQHLARCHRKPIYCPICNDTFEDEDEKDIHIRKRNCTPRPSIVIEGISEKQKRELSNRVSSKMPEEQQWFAVFDTLFSPHPRPRTPYRDRELSDDLCVFQDFMAVRGPALLADFLEAKGVMTSNLSQEERDLATFKKEVLGEGLQLIIDQWTSDSATAIDPTSNPHSLRSSPTVDSGIAMHTNRSKVVTSSGDLISSNPGDENRDNENQRAASVSSQVANPDTGADTLQANDGPEYQPLVMAGMSADPSGPISARPGREGMLGGMPDHLAMSQFTALPNYAESAVYPTGTDDSCLLNFDIEWPT
ncbi:hypothetical protein F5Y04DRAFT_99570 [Hypomontagnella monticulosa]|nr:hypothetical protein F5Y04DRAFT_99570 [Hypomontagnella monticulosa]